MKKTLFVLLFSMVVAFAGSSGMLNVKDFGAKGDGKTDDTKAIQAAFDAAWNNRIDMKCGPYFTGNATDEVVFPAGHYVISDTLQVNNVNVRGEGKAYIHQKNREKDIFYYKFALWVDVDNLNFVGGQAQISFWNNNAESGRMLVTRCTFFNAQRVSVETRLGTNSSFFIVKECTFDGNMQSIISNSDKTTIADCWISTMPRMKDMATIVNGHGIMTIDRMLGVPLCKEANQRWIDNLGGAVLCNDCRFGGEGGGFTPVWNFAKCQNHTECVSMVAIRNSDICAESSYKAQCAIYCVQIPNIISIENCRLNGYAPIKIDRQLDVSNCFDNIMPGLVSYQVHNCIGHRVSEIPEILVNPQCKGKLNIPGQISLAESKKLLEERLANLPPPVVENDGRESVSPPPKHWSVDVFMDSTAEKNSERIMMAHKDGRCLLMWRAKSSGWPHVEIKDFEVDVDKYPFLQVIYGNAANTPLDTAVRVYDEDEGVQYLVSGQSGPTNITKDLRTFGLKGKKCLSLRIYYIGSKYVAAKQGEQRFHYENVKPGDFIVLDRVRFAAEK